MNSSPTLLEQLIAIFKTNQWQYQTVAKYQVIESYFQAHFTNISIIAQAIPRVNGVCVISEAHLNTWFPVEEASNNYHKTSKALLAIVQYANKKLHLGSFEYDIDRAVIVFKISNCFLEEKLDTATVTMLVHIAISEIDRFYAVVSALQNIPEASPAEINDLLSREDFIPPIATHESTAINLDEN